ncbi:hypothetical protein MRX96_052566 [Rhipicephalus microplus]
MVDFTHKLIPLHTAICWFKSTSQLAFQGTYFTCFIQCTTPVYSLPFCQEHITTRISVNVFHLFHSAHNSGLFLCHSHQFPPRSQTCMLYKFFQYCITYCIVLVPLA